MGEDQHQHCSNCYIYHCSAAKCCKMVFCQSGCGARMHDCKSDDHKFVCPKQVIPCVCAAFGCPVRLQRGKLRKHISVCPASVVFCTMEWNRYPLYSKSRLSWVPFFQPNPVLVKGQLDVELALRDQKVLEDMSKKRLRKGKAKVDILRLNKLKLSRSTAVANENDGDKNSRHVNSQMAIALSSLEQKFKSMKVKDEGIRVLTPKAKGQEEENIKIAVMKNSEYETETMKSEVKEVNTTAMLRNGISGEEDKEVLTQLVRGELRSKSDRSLDTRSGQNENHEREKGSRLSQEIIQSCLEKNKEYIQSNINEDLATKSQGVQETREHFNSPQAVSLKTFKDAEIQCDPLLSQPPTFADIYLAQPLGLNIMLETLPKFQKQSPLYSIPCNQIFRRDEYAAHFKNVHSEIHGGLNGWLEHRCPLAQYGCTFVHHRLLPDNQCGQVIFNQDLGSFGIRPCLGTTDEQSDPNCTHHVTMETDQDYFNLLPEEILDQIAGMLDGFSLCNFSRTSKLLRQACQRMVEKKGMVALEWEKRIHDDGLWSWQVRQKKWFFSTACTSIKNWVHSDKPGMLAHLEKCPFFDHYTSREKFCYQGIEKGNDEEYDSKGDAMEANLMQYDNEDGRNPAEPDFGRAKFMGAIY